MAHRRSLVSAALLTVGLIVGSAFGTGGCTAEPFDGDGDDEELLDEETLADYMDDDGPGDGEDGVSSVSSELGGCRQCTNCVLYARCRQPRLPYGLTSWSSKLRIINSRTPRVGCVAVIKTGSQWGHVAYVKGVSGSTISIDEGNWGRRCNSRRGTAAALKIQGYWCPR